MSRVNIAIASTAVVLVCGSPDLAGGAQMIEKKPFGKTAAGEEIDLYTLRSG